MAGHRSSYKLDDLPPEFKTAEYKKNILPQHFTLNNGVEMPAIGLGTYRIRHHDVVMHAVDAALSAGYRSFDTAALYDNEDFLSLAFKRLLPKYGLERSDIFITTKLSPCDYGGTDLTERAFAKSIKNLGVDYIDLFLIHFPGNARVQAFATNNALMRELTWGTLTDLYHDKQINAIGVSNFTVRHLSHLMECNHGVIPMVNQVEWHPYYNQPELHKYCKENNIQLQAYSPLGGTSCSILLSDPTIVRIAKKHKVTPAQVLLVWSLQQNIAVIPKSVDPDRLKENITLHFTLPQEDLQAINALRSKNTKFSWDPTHVY